MTTETTRIIVTSRSFGSVSDKPTAILRDTGADVWMMGADFDQESFNKAVTVADALIIGAHPFPEDVLRRCSRLKLIAKHGVGLDNIPLAAAREMGVHVTNAPNTNSNAVADLAFGLLLASARGIVRSAGNLRTGNVKPVVGTDVCDKTLGLLGLGAIAREVACRARGFRMRVLAADPFVTRESLGEDFAFVELCDRERVVRECDFLSLHLPLTEETRYLVDAAVLRSMKPSAHLVNTARGGIVDEAALYEAVRDGVIAGAALDVAEVEPVPPDHPLLTLERIIVTNHIGMYSIEALNAVSMICAENVAAQLSGRPLRHKVGL